MAEFLIGKRLVGDDHPPLVVAEIGINHEGSLVSAIEMADAALDAGAEAIKHQTHSLWDEMSEEARHVIPGNETVSIYDVIARCALDERDEKALRDHVVGRGAIYFSTPFSRSAVDRLERLDVPVVKIGSGECNNYPLVKYVARLGKPIILSTGMNTIDSIRPAVEILRLAQVPFALLHCTNLYPTPPNLIRLQGMVELKEAFPDAVVGLSDHSVTNDACIGATALGARILERHFTDRMDRPGPDISCSMDPQSLALLIQGSGIVFEARGGSKQPAYEEQVTMDFAFASVVAIRDIAVGETLTEENIWVMRPSGGAYSAKDYESLLGQVCKAAAIAGRQLPAGSVEDGL